MSLEIAQQLCASGHHEEARVLLVALCQHNPEDADLHYECACLHDVLGLEAEAVPFYLAALAGNLPPAKRRGAYTGLGSTYRTLGQFQSAYDTLVAGLQAFPEANEMRVFLAMTQHNLGHSKVAVEALLMLIATTTDDPAIQAYRRAIAFYAQDVEQTWPNAAP